MSASRPNRGSVGAPAGAVIVGSGLLAGLQASGFTGTATGEKATRSGAWRPDTPFNGRDGLKVTMRRVRGLTPEGVLEVPLRFQVPPLNEFVRKWTTNWARYDTVDEGERLRNPQRPLWEWTMASMLLDGPAQDDAAFVVWDDAPDPQRLLTELRWIMGEDEDQDGVPFKLTVSQTAHWGNAMLVSKVCVLTDLQATQKPGELGTEYVDLSFVELRDQRVERKGAGKARPKESDRPKLMPVGEDDSLHDLARRAYRAASEWRAIAQQNGITGVSPSSAAELRKWMKRHDKTKLLAPAVIVRVTGSVVGSGLAGAL